MKNIFILIFAACISLTATATEYTYNPGQMDELKSKLKGKLSPGDIVYLEDGTYSDFEIVFTGKGAGDAPISLKAKNPGKVIITGNIHIRIGGDYLVVDGLVLKDGQAATGRDIIEFRTSSNNPANNCRLTNTVIDNCNHPDDSYRTSTRKSERWVMLYGKNNRVDHCYFTNKINGGVLMMVNLSDEQSRENNHIIEYNFFSRRPEFEPENNAEIIRLGDSHTSQQSCKTVVQNNFFYACDGEVEIISIKSGENIIRKNVFYESRGSVVCRHGNNNRIENNAFVGNNKRDCGGVRIINEGHRVCNNYFQDLPGKDSWSALCIMMGIFEKPDSTTNIEKEPLNAYHRVRNVEITHNTFINCKNIDLGRRTVYNYSSSNPFAGQTLHGALLPECLIAKNVFYNTKENSIFNRVGLNDKYIVFEDNIYRSKKTVNMQGLEKRDMYFEKIKSGKGKGFYVSKNRDSDPSAPYQFGDKNFPFTTVKPEDCGVKWYPSLQKELTDIEKKVTF